MTGDGFGEASRWQLTALQLEGSLDQTELFRGGSTSMRLRVLGSKRPLAIRLRNVTPEVISLQGGEEQVATSSGGAENLVERWVEARGRGGFDIQWSLDIDPCPCAGSGTVH